MTTAIDLDGSLPADPAKDVAEFVADLRSGACEGRYDRETALSAADAFVEEYLAQAPEAAARVSCYSACRLTMLLLNSMKLGTLCNPSQQFESYLEAIGLFCQ